ncbi:hypothetical protein DNHGIG_06280 [Collibacillus ludicampi]|jgi:uncharacterized membrane protein|uniref:DUF2269 family protein n=1 Tax=Collibacillus ludicampi TaxID=2771369 RepID=A0AAV4LBP4_9BACL|nr:DUF2269 family protein [Collibacillus ludicampi]GIM45079.1 hypothetical protein DNHGIG_06280 [Collibacillus ludicampi]
MIFYVMLALHGIAVLVKLGLLLYIPFLKNVTQVQSFLEKYRKIDRAADLFLWGTGAGMLFVTSWSLLLQTWLWLSILLYVLVFLLIKKVLIRRLQEIAASKKIYARDEIKTLRTENLCVGLVIVALLASIGTLMVTKPSF